ncbi:MAG: hypothetical protein JJE04_11550 [Acidobacteriia bacterium]|nr:hypothetical protein [Terriglobia bacterium]
MIANLMPTKWRALSLFAACLLAPANTWGAEKPLELKWGELAAIVSGHMVEVTVNEGKVKGEAIAIRDDTLVVNVSKTSAPGYSKGSAVIPKNAITLIKVQRERSTWGRTLGTVVGVVAGLGVGGYTAAHVDSGGGGVVAVLVAVTSGIAVLGYYAGKQLDRRQTTIRILP